MAVLKNPRHEKFAQFYAKSGNGTQSYLAAGFQATGNAANVNASRLLTHAKVSARIAELRGKIADGVVKLEISKRSARVQALQDRWDRMRRVIDARAADPLLKEAPGGDTGLMVRTQKALGTGPLAEIVDEFTIDAGLLRELRAHEEQAAKELGQWTDKVQHSTPEGKPLELRYSNLADDELRMLLALTRKAAQQTEA